MQERFTKQAQNVLALARQAAGSCGHSYIGTEHLLMGLLREKEGTAGRVLEDFGIDADKAMALIDKLIAPPGTTVLHRNRNSVQEHSVYLRTHVQRRNLCILRRQEQNIFCLPC